MRKTEINNLIRAQRHLAKAQQYIDRVNEKIRDAESPLMQIDSNNWKNLTSLKMFLKYEAGAKDEQNN